MTDYAFDDKPKNDNKLKRERTGQPLTWTQVFQLVLARPSVKSFETILNDPTVSRRRAWSWIGVATVISLALTVGLFFIYDITSSSSLPGFAFLGFMIFLMLIFSLVGFYLVTRLLQLSARILGARIPFLDLFYAMAAFNAPLMVINYGVSLAAGLSGGNGTMVSVNLISLFLSLYQLVLTAMAIKTTTRFSWGRSVASMVVFVLLVLAIYALLIGLMVILLVFPTMN